MQNSTKLTLAIENLYRIFRRYPLDLSMGTSFTVHESDKAELYTPNLRSLSSEQLLKYTLKAMTSWGDISDFKHFLPRILELQSEEKFLDKDLIETKLELAQYNQWSANEKLAIKRFFQEYWAEFMVRKSTLSFEFLVFIAKFVDLNILLEIWENKLKEGYDTFAFVILINFIESDSENLTVNPNITDNKDLLISSWIKRHIQLVEQAFFECKDDELQTKISQALQKYDFYNKV